MPWFGSVNETRAPSSTVPAVGEGVRVSAPTTDHPLPPT
jgi:hypothetical protein